MPISWLMRATSGAGQTGQRTVVGDAQKNQTAFGVGKRRHLRSERVGVGHILLELAAAVFAERHLRFQLVQVHESGSDSISRLTVAPHTGQAPVSTRSPPATSPRKSVILIARLQWEHHTLASSFACAHAGILCQRAAAAGVERVVVSRLRHEIIILT